MFQKTAIHYEDTLNKAGYIDKVIYQAPSTSNQEKKIVNGTLYGLTYHIVKVSQQE